MPNWSSLRNKVSLVAELIVVVSALAATVAVLSGYVKNRFDAAVTDHIEAQTPSLIGAEIEAFTSTPREAGDQQGFSNNAPFGQWSDPVFCPSNHYVCGLRQRVEGRQGSGDDTAMNAVAFYCCPLAAVPDEP